MQTPITVTADMRSFIHFGMDTALFAKITGLNQPDSTKIGVKETDNIVSYNFEFFFRRGRRKKLLLKQIDTLLP